MSKPKKSRTVDVCKALALPVLEELGLELWDLRFEKEGSGWYLRYFIDKEGGVTIQDCEAFSRAVDKLLDEADPIEQSYVLEVSSPGIERRLTRPEHFERYVGSRVHLRLIRPIPPQNMRDLSGILLARNDAGVVLRTDDGVEHLIADKDIAFAKLEIDF